MVVIVFLSVKRCLLPEDDVNFIRQKSLLIPASHREPKSGSLKRRHVYIPTNTTGNPGSGMSQSDKMNAYTTETGATTGVDDGIVECSSTESVNNERKSNSEAYEDVIDSREPRRRHNTTVKQNLSSGGGGDDVSSMSATHNASQALNVSSTSSATIAAAAIAAAASRGGAGAQRNRYSRSSETTQYENNPSTDAMCEDLVNAVRYLMNIQEQVESQNLLVAEWRLVAQSVDRILFWIFAVMTIVSSTVLLLILPLYKRSTDYSDYGPETDGSEGNDSSLDWNYTSTTIATPDESVYE